MMVGELRTQLAAAGTRLAGAGLIRGSEGNLSARIDAESCVVTSTGSSTGRLDFRELVVVRLDGGEIPARATSEAHLHLDLYRRRPEIMAIVHAHPPAVLCLAEQGRLPDVLKLEDDEQLVGRPVEVAYFPEGSSDLAEAVAAALDDACACVLLDHGAVTVGATVEQALGRMLSLERAAARSAGR